MASVVSRKSRVRQQSKKTKRFGRRHPRKTRRDANTRTRRNPPGRRARKMRATDAGRILGGAAVGGGLGYLLGGGKGAAGGALIGGGVGALTS